jgi:hypothetical protein
MLQVYCVANAGMKCWYYEIHQTILPSYVVRSLHYKTVFSLQIIKSVFNVNFSIIPLRFFLFLVEIYNFQVIVLDSFLGLEGVVFTLLVAGFLCGQCICPLVLGN